MGSWFGKKMDSLDYGKWFMWRKILLRNGLSLIDPRTFEEKDFINEAVVLNTMSSDGKYGYVSRVVRQVSWYLFFNLCFRDTVTPMKKSIWSIKLRTTSTSRKFPATRKCHVFSESFPVWPTANGTKTILFFQWNPNPNRSDFVFVHDYNLYYQSDPERPGTAVQITKDGDEFFRYGVTDWLYEGILL